ncbi:hypothetical protein [Methylobacterium oryzihabitans]|uniref:Uncharacterized protein n=1 Tax=Methylobacterium oryzihabitans TaxID=2499852 RepID=A0A3S2W509_9HYPH|nr:hypothetical protein [Methylobacterium oryzihabitans]RVU13851.1 hypothetical protein EOE48_25750 [Methylobacterium oryzihabitans]
MVRLVKATFVAALVSIPGAVLAQSGGDRMPAGGAFMSSYARPYDDPRSPYAGVQAPAPAFLAQPEATGSLRERAAPHAARHGRAR